MPLAEKPTKARHCNKQYTKENVGQVGNKVYCGVTVRLKHYGSSMRVFCPQSVRNFPNFPKVLRHLVPFRKKNIQLYGLKYLNS